MKQRRNIIFAIGIDEYESKEWENLKNAVLDTRMIVNSLVTRYSFEIYPEILINSYATKTNIYNAFNTLRTYIEPDDNLIIFFAGHGHMHPFTYKGYWIPHEGTANIDTYIENSVVKDFVESIEAQHIWIITDACFAGTFLSRTRGGANSQPYYKLDSKISRWMLAAGGEEKVSDGTIGNNSPFSKFLIKYLENNLNSYTCVSEIIKYVTTLTKKNSLQTPTGSYLDNIGHEGGEMVLALKDIFIKYDYKITRGVPNTPNLLQELRKNQRNKSKLPTGKELLIIDGFLGSKNYFIIENFRFDDNGEKRIKFKNGKAIIKSKEGEIELNLVQRFATWEGVKRFIEKDSEIYKNVKILGARDIENVEDSEFAILHSDYLQELLSINKGKMNCLHCGEAISTNDNFLVEIDELGLKDNIGNIHIECLRPADRILGKTAIEGIKESKLVNFDYEKWGELLQKGQAQINGIKKKISKISIIAWNQANNINEGEYCIKSYYENGSSFYLMTGKQIERFKKNEIDSYLERFNKEIEVFIMQGNPLGMIVETKINGNFKLLESIKAPEETITFVSRYEKEKFSKQLEANINEIENDYTPLGLVLYAESKEIVKLGDDIIPLISNPMNFDTLLQNWNSILEPWDGKFTIRIISSDIEFDSLILMFFNDGVSPIIDPIFDTKTNELVSGYPIKDISDLAKKSWSEQEYPNLHSEVQEEHSESESGYLISNPNWRKGDLVKVLLPLDNAEPKDGILLVDEFIDSSGEPCVIFRPTENGNPIMDMQFKLPSKYLIKKR